MLYSNEWIDQRIGGLVIVREAVEVSRKQIFNRLQVPSNAAKVRLNKRRLRKLFLGWLPALWHAGVDLIDASWSSG